MAWQMLHLYFLSSGQFTRPTVFFLGQVSCGLADVALVFPELRPVHQTDSVLSGQSVTKAEESDDENVLELGFLLILEIVQKGETFTQWSTYRHFNLLWKSFHRTFHDHL